MGSLFKSPVDGKTYDVPPEQADRYLAEGYTPVGVEERAGQVSAAAADARAADRGVVGSVNAAATSGLSGLTLGASDVALRALLDPGEFDRLQGDRTANPGISAVGEGVGAVTGALASGGTSLLARTPAAAVTRLGARIAKTGEGAGALAKIGRATVGGTVEGGLYGAGTATSQLALSDDPLTVERIASAYSSNMLFGGGVGGVVGGVAKAAELGLVKAKGVIDAAAERHAAASAVPEDLAGLDRAGLRAAEDAELKAIETARVPQRQQIADDLAAFRAEQQEAKTWLATEKLTDKVIGKEAGKMAVQEIGAITKKADDALRNLLRNPKALAENPAIAKRALQQQEHALEQMLTREDALRAAFAADTSGTRAAALDAVPALLEKNKAFQARIGELAAKPASERLAAIAAAGDVLKSGGGATKASLPEQLMQGSVFGAVTSLASPLGPLAPLLGARAASFVTDKVFGKMKGALGAAAQRSQKVAATFVDVGQKVLPRTPVVASKVLSGVMYAPAEKPTKAPKQQKSGKPSLVATFRTRAHEIRSQTTIDPMTGKYMMRPEAREALGARLDPIRAVDAQLADQIETLAARKITFLAGKLPMRPDMGIMQIGPDRWTPSDMEIRRTARFMSAVEDPAAAEERLLDGTFSPEDAEALREVYPERVADLTRQIVEKLPELQKTLPYQRRLSLSILTGVPVDPAMHPGVLRVLQRQYGKEPGTEQGTQAPLAKAQFGSVRAETGTPAQQRQGAGL